MNLSLYIHVPFCAKKCRYCDFYSVAYDEDPARDYLAAVSREIEYHLHDPSMAESTVRTVYIGGGTPSILSVNLLADLCSLVRDRFALADDREWTVECNPDSFTEEKAAVLLENGVTRLSFGVQSMEDRELSLLGRIHSATRCAELLDDPVLAGFKSVSADLMYGLPGQTDESLSRTVDTMVASHFVRHVSAYELTIAPGTPFGRHQSIMPLRGQEQMERITQKLWQKLEDAGFRQYEVSNFAQAGYECRHNEVYWDHGNYLGLGAAAHSFIDGQRWANVKDVKNYCSAGETGFREFIERIDEGKMASEMLFLGLRRAKGIDEEAFKQRCGVDFVDYVNNDKLDLFQQKGLIVFDKPFWKPTKKGLLLADAMARYLTPS
jgi:oxygen-independent coproporphyrinogen III oxidase